MVRIEKSIEIKASPEKVWEMLALDRQLEWMDEAEWESVEYISEVHTPEDKYKVGASAHITEKHGEYDFEITESLENEKITARSKAMRGEPYSTHGSVTLTSTYILEPVEEGTKLTCVGDIDRIPWGILGKILYKLNLQRKFRKQVEKSLEKLKSILEK